MRIVLAGLLAGLSMLTVTPAAATPRPDAAPRLALPAPTGTLDVGTTAFPLVDDSRDDPWQPAEKRELMVTMWYPTVVPSTRPARYLSAAESKAFLDFQRAQGVPIPADLPDDALSTTRTHAAVGVPPSPQLGGYPLVVLSPGFTLPRATLTGLAEDLASHGYVVAAVDHAYESSGTEFPGGLKRCVACDVANPTDIPPVRAADVSYVLDRLLDRHSAWRHGRLIDASRIAMVGHSIGGASALTAAEADDRIDAGVDLDGTFFDRLPATGLAKPFLMLGTQRLHHAGGDDESWDETWARLHGPRYWFSVDDTGHLAFTDTALLADQIGIEDPSAPLPGVRASEITRAYVGAFVDRHLRGRSGSLLDGATDRYPEVHPQP